MIVAMPTELQKFLTGLTETRQDGTIRTSMSAGAPKLRLRFSAITRRLQGRIALWPDELSAFLNFYGVTIAEGSGKFTFTHPITLVTETAIFAETPAITYPPTRGNKAEITISLDLLP